MIFSFSIVGIFFDKYICITAITIALISDSLAALYGQKYGRITLINNRTLEGSYIFCISTFTILYFFLLNNLILLIIFSILITLVELLTPSKYDNFTIPIFSSIIIYIHNIL